jgi:hypothetical protein
MNAKMLKTRLIEKINTLSEEQLKLIADIINQFDESSNSEIMTAEESQAMKKWEYLIQHNKEIDKADPLSNEEINFITTY